MTMIRNAFVSLLLILCLAAAAPAEEALIPVDEAFQYVVSDTGVALEIDWAIEECCYLYRDKLTFESGDARIVFVEARTAGRRSARRRVFRRAGNLSGPLLRHDSLHG